MADQTVNSTEPAPETAAAMTDPAAESAAAQPIETAVETAAETAGADLAGEGVASEEFNDAAPVSPPAEVEAAHALDMLGDVELDVRVELGRCQMMVGDVMRLAPGNVVELDKLAGDPVDIHVNDRLVARGEVLVVNEDFCVRVNEIVSTDE